MAQLNSTSSSEANHGDRNLCRLHQKVCTIFCLDCSVGICGNCMDSEDQHMLHQITNLTIVYREKLASVKSKMVQAEKHNNELRLDTVAYERNLLLLEKEESSVRKELEAIVEASQSEVFNMTSIRKKALRDKLELPTTNATHLMDLRSKIGQLSENEFVQQFPKIDELCDELIGAPKVAVFENVDDIKCDLIPPYQFQKFVYKGFLNAKIDSKQVFKLKSAQGVEWKLTVNKSAIVQVKLSPSDPQVLAFRHMLIVIIPHEDYTKEIHQALELNEHSDTLMVDQTIHILGREFCNNRGDLVMKIGIRPSNTIIEKELLDYQNRKLSRQLHSITDKHDYNHLIMYYKPKLTEIQQREELFSLQIMDDEGRQWRLNVLLSPKDVVGIYVQLFQGSSVNCSFFVELKHINPKKSIEKIEAKRHFTLSEHPSWGWEPFIAWEELSRDTGFHPDGYLNFRFGVRPLPTDCETSAPCAATA